MPVLSLRLLILDSTMPSDATIAPSISSGVTTPVDIEKLQNESSDVKAIIVPEPLTGLRTFFLMTILCCAQFFDIINGSGTVIALPAVCHVVYRHMFHHHALISAHSTARKRPKIHARCNTMGHICIHTHLRIFPRLRWSPYGHIQSENRFLRWFFHRRIV